MCTYVCMCVYTCIWGEDEWWSGLKVAQRDKNMKNSVFMKGLGPPLWRMHVPHDRAKQAKR